MNNKKEVSSLDELFISKEQEFWFNKGYECSQKEKPNPINSIELEYWKNSREILELKLLEILNMFPKESKEHKKIWKILVNVKHFNIINNKKFAKNKENGK